MKTKLILSAKQLTPLIEIILAMAFFAATSTILIQVFSKAHTDSRLAHDINSAMLFVSEYVEQIRRADTYSAVEEVLFRGGFQEADSTTVTAAGNDSENDKIDSTKSDNSSGIVFIIYLDDSFSPILRNAAYANVTYEISIKEGKAGSLITGQFVCIRKDGKELVRMDTAVFSAGAIDK